MQADQKFEIFPYAHQTNNVVKNGDTLVGLTIPDIAPTSLPENSNMSMVAGEFNEIYRTEDHLTMWDVVATSFFIDTAKNVLDYVETIHKILKPGGLWINIGPLLYHFSQVQGEVSIELTFQELCEVISLQGFEFLKQQIGIHCDYTNNQRSMIQTHYNAGFFVCRRL